jgi:predicted nucleic acid-binding protein
MTVVLDTSAAVETVLGRLQANEITDILAIADWVIAPDVFIPEVTNVFWKYHTFEDLPVDECEDWLDKTLALVDDTISSQTLYQEAFSLACNLGQPVYDVLYLILARRYNAQLLTIDKKLRNIALKQSIKVNIPNSEQQIDEVSEHN